MTEGLGPDWVLWVAENLWAGAPPAHLIAGLVENGVPADVAAAQVEAIRGAPAFDGVRRRLARGRMLEKHAAVRLAHRPSIPVVADIDADAFHRAHWVGGQPLVLTGAIRFPALAWTFASLAGAHGDVEIEVNTGRVTATRRSAVERGATRMPFRELLVGIEVPGDDRYAVSRNGLLASVPALEADLRPLPAFLDPERPRASLWIGPAGTRTDWHFDTHDVLLVQVVGRKRFAIASPEHPELFEQMDGFYATAPVQPDHELELGPGEALFLPVGWWHRVDALTPSITATFLGFRWPNDWHDYRPSPS